MNEFDYMSWIVIPVMIFIARLCDVSLATLRHILIFKGLKKIVPFFGFIEVLIWLVAITQVMQNLHNIACYLGFAFGFAAGTYVGIILDEKLALGHQLVRIITERKVPELRAALNANRFGATVVPAQGSKGPVDIFFVATERKRLAGLLACIRNCDPTLFYTVEDVRSVSKGGVFGHNAETVGALAMEGTIKKK